MSNEAVWAKFDFPRAAVSRLPELFEAFRREGAWRACLVAKTAAALTPQSDFSVIKVPALEGTELWLVLREEKEAVERAIGFSKQSEPLLKLTGESLAEALRAVGQELEATDETVELTDGRTA